MKLLATLALALLSSTVEAGLSTESQANYPRDDSATPTFDWNITVLELLSIDKPTEEQGIYTLRSKYVLDDRSFDVEFYKVDCLTPATAITDFPINFKKADIVDDGSEIDVELFWTYNQTEVENSDIWTANMTGGYSKFCIKVSNYLEEDDDFSREIHFLEVKYEIQVDSLTDFNATIDVARIDATDGGIEEINYEEEITVYQCKDNFDEITSPVPLTQGDFLQLCVTTVTDSKFGVHSIKELDVSQLDATPSLYPYVDGFIDSPLAVSDCKMDVKNTSAAVCKAKMQLLSAYFDLDDPADLFANGTVKLDYVGRRLTVDVPVSLRYSDSVATDQAGRALAEEDGASFGLEVGLSGEAGESDATALSMGALFSAGMAFFAAGML